MCSATASCLCLVFFQYAHRRCVQRWCNEKGDTICEICHQVGNLYVTYRLEVFLMTSAFSPCTSYCWPFVSLCWLYVDYSLLGLVIQLLLPFFDLEASQWILGIFLRLAFAIIRKLNILFHIPYCFSLTMCCGALLRGNWGIVRRDLNNPRLIAVVSTDRDFIDSDDYDDDYAVSTSRSMMCCRSVTMIVISLSLSVIYTHTRFSLRRFKLWRSKHKKKPKGVQHLLYIPKK